jgi:hypothetical protein
LQKLLACVFFRFYLLELLLLFYAVLYVENWLDKVLSSSRKKRESSLLVSTAPSSTSKTKARLLLVSAQSLLFTAQFLYIFVFLYAVICILLLQGQFSRFTTSIIEH